MILKIDILSKKLNLNLSKKKPKNIYEFLSQLNRLTNKEEISFKFIFSGKKQSCNEKDDRFFEIYCIDASYAMKDYLSISPYSTILTSGTLSINLIQNLLQIHFRKLYIIIMLSKIINFLLILFFQSKRIILKLILVLNLIIEEIKNK